jgi:signal peptidase I
MEDCLYQNDVILVLKSNFLKKVSWLVNINKQPFSQNNHFDIKRNDVVVFLHKNKKSILVKRCVGLKDDMINIFSDMILCNGNKILLNTQKYGYHIWYNDIVKYNKIITELNLDRFSIWHEDWNNKNYQNLSQFEFDLISTCTFIDSIKLAANPFKLESNYKYLRIHGLFVLGDNLNCSFDSRHFGIINEEQITGKAILVIFNYHNGKFRWDRFLKKIE